MQRVSIVVPVKDEQDTIREMVAEVEASFAGIDAGTAKLEEIVFVDDGSRDGSWAEIASLSESSPRIKGIRLRRNFGKAAALQAGLRQASGSVVVTMDGDLQDDPAEIPRFLEQIRQGSDVVSGWKKVRHDPLGKRLPSKIFNKVTALVSGVRLNDFNCGFKAYRREVFEDIDLYGELHRFIPALAHAMGFSVSELVVRHRPRKFGKSKYGVGRLLKGFLDLLTVVTITRFSFRPGHLFGTLGVVVGMTGGLIFLYLCMLWLRGEPIGTRPILVVSTLLMTVGLQFLLFGMVAELIVATRQRHDSDRHDRTISETVNIAGRDDRTGRTRPSLPQS